MKRLQRFAVRGLPAATWLLLAVATSAAVLLLRLPIQFFPAHDISIAALPVFTVALLAGPVVGALAAAATAVAALLTGSMTTLLAVLLLSAPLLGYVHFRLAHPAYACFVAPIAASVISALLAAPGADRLHLVTVGSLQSAISVIVAYGLSLLIAGRPAIPARRLGRTTAHASAVRDAGDGRNPADGRSSAAVRR